MKETFSSGEAMASKVHLIWLLGYHSTCVANIHIIENLLCIDIRCEEEISFKSAYLRLLSAALITKLVREYKAYRPSTCFMPSAKFVRLFDS
jgi:hypothetical protein